MSTRHREPGTVGRIEGVSERRPVPGRVLYTDSLVVLDGTTGALRWYD
ncbi:MAG TPA: hypothetical protein VFM96_16125 [Gaiellaceae bacterium]|nr:hypothetical protein [Gaiellaceae bacterium]